jgi:predicted ribosome quality control (RQC) complex YloA/Tae2 family protein
VQEGRGETVIQTAPSSLARNAQAGEAGLEAAWDFIFGAMARGERHPVALHTPEPAAYPVPVVQVPAEAQTPVEDLNRALDAAYAARLEQAGFVSLIAEFAGRVEQALKRLRRREQSVERALQEAERAETYQQSGELLLANLWRVQPGDTSVTVTDYYALEPVERAISLDAQLSPQENADAYFRRARKTRAAAARAQEERAAVRQDMERLETAARALALWRAEGPGAEETVRRLREELTAEGLLRSDRTGETEGDRRARPDFQGHKIRRYTTPEGYEILVGESATANDFLTTRVAAPNDLWLHVRAAASAHVVIRTQGHPERVPRSVLEEAARLCVQHSGQKHSSLVPVDYTLKKFVRKPRKAPPGTVQIQQEKTLHITP